MQLGQLFRMYLGPCCHRFAPSCRMLPSSSLHSSVDTPKDPESDSDPQLVLYRIRSTAAGQADNSKPHQIACQNMMAATGQISTSSRGPTVSLARNPRNFPPSALKPPLRCSPPVDCFAGAILTCFGVRSLAFFVTPAKAALKQLAIENAYHGRE